MGPLPVPERNDNLPLLNLRPQPCTPIPSPTSRSSSRSSDSDPRTPVLSSESANAVTFTSNIESEDTKVASSLRKRRRSTFQHASPAPKKCRDAVLEENPLCEHCLHIDFQKVLDVEVMSLQKESNGILLADLGKRCNDLSTASKCPLCHLFHQSRVQPKSSAEYQLRIYSYLKSTKTIAFGLSKERHRETDIACLGVVPSRIQGETFRKHADAAGHLFCLKEDTHHDSLFRPRIPAQDAALSQVKTWLDFCASHHSPCQNRESRVTGLKLLDCETYVVVPAPANANYLALSYVWGATIGHSETPAMGYDAAPKSNPRITKTIHDAVAAAKGLGYRYLWVDKLCIDQGNAEEKHHQISQMDSIYGSADMTIIAACGNDSHYGLPGVNGTPRTLQRNVKAGNFDVFTSMCHPHHHIRSSKWFSRGWTLQEACLSTRRLVFTANQLYFECNTMHCSENVVPNLDLTHDSKKFVYLCFQSGMLSTNMGGRFVGAEPKYALWQHCLYLALVVEYTKRTLTFEDDRPKAFAGIMRHFASKGFFEIWGVAYYYGHQGFIQGDFIRGLLWAHKTPLDQAPDARDGEDSSIDMTLGLPDSTSMPSWSWMRWRGEIVFPLWRSSIYNLVRNIRLEPQQNLWVNFHYYHYAIATATGRVLPYHITPPKVLLLDVHCVKVSEISIDGIGNLKVYGYKTDWYISRGPLQPEALYQLFKSEKLELLLVAWDKSTLKIFLMIVEKLVGLAVRLGICVVHFGFPPRWPGDIRLGQRKWVRLG